MDKRILFLKSYLLENLHRKFSIEELANLVNFSPVYLRQLFKAETGQTITQYIRQLRLAKAKELLENKFLRVKEVGVAVGLPNQSKFTQYFKEAYGMTPSECQDLHNNKQMDG
jgi:two-component system response regulator YesN